MLDQIIRRREMAAELAHHFWTQWDMATLVDVDVDVDAITAITKFGLDVEVDRSENVATIAVDSRARSVPKCGFADVFAQFQFRDVPFSSLTDITSAARSSICSTTARATGCGSTDGAGQGRDRGSPR